MKRSYSGSFLRFLYLFAYRRNDHAIVFGGDDTGPTSKAQSGPHTVNGSSPVLAIAARNAESISREVEVWTDTIPKKAIGGSVVSDCATRRRSVGNAIRRFIGESFEIT